MLPGMQVPVVNPSNSVTLSDDGVSGPHSAVQTVLTFSSPVDGAATWAKLVDMKWNSATCPMIQHSKQVCST